MDTKIEYQIRPVTRKESFGDPLLQMEGRVVMADYHSRRNLGSLRVDLRTVTTRMDWGKGSCRFEIEASAAAEVLTSAFDKAVGLIGLSADRC